ncbi:MAG: hypothetical protein DLM52_04430 [Chthoniobacterales bacterium]|nr:MAG: hypothetical protein DLM52_04430 [Chthoniobacterales bacterium]
MASDRTNPASPTPPVEYLSSRSFIIAIAGVLVGGLVGFSLGRSHIGSTSVQQRTTSKNHTTAAVSKSGKTALFSASDDDPSHVSLGNITTVPFQELYGVLSSLPPEKLDELAAQLRQLPDDKQTAAKIATFFKAWAHIDPKAALRAAIAFKSAEAKTTAITAVIDSADATQAEALAKAIREWPEGALGRGQRDSFLASALAKWAQVAPADAAKFFDANSVAGRHFSWTASVIAQNWAPLDPQAAMSWAQSLADKDGFNNALSGAVTGWWSKDHAAAEAYALAHMSDAAGRQLATHLANYMYSREPERAKDWVSRLPDVQARQQATNMLVGQMCWSDPQAAAEWAATLPTDVRDTSLRLAVHSWTATDASTAGDWINTLTGAAHDQAASAYTASLANKNPAAAAQWAMSISDVKLRDSSLDRVASEWLRKNAGEASAWIQNSGLPVNQKQRLLALAPKQGGG